LRPYTRTSFHHQPEAQHPKSSAIHKLAGRLPHLLGVERTLSPPLHGGDLSVAFRRCRLIGRYRCGELR
jgi:hypothetical protein